jgi:hypothetical protein
MPDGLIGPHGRLFGEQSPGADEKSFLVSNTDDAYYKSPYYALHQDQLQPVPKPSGARLDLTHVVGTAFLAPIKKAKRISFHCVGDTGASSEQKIKKEASVADAMVADLGKPGADAPAFFYHLGDVIYNFGEAQFYYDQLYEPFRAYDRPIFAIPGNHDGGVQFGSDTGTPLAPTLLAFLRNFCAATPGPSPDAGGLIRSVMCQPGVYFTLDAPCVSIIGLYTNVLEGPGVISSQGGTYPSMIDDQVDFLVSELRRLKPAREKRQRAIVLACHHPPASADATHGGATGLSNDIDTACNKAGIWPDVVLSGHAHLYQRFHRAAGARTIPYIVAGSGGHNASKPRGSITGNTPITLGDFTLMRDPLVEYGYLTITVDLSSAGAESLAVDFMVPGQAAAADSVSVNLASGAVR